MKFLIIPLFLLALVLPNTGRGESKKVLLKDTAIFRVKDEVYFDSDLKKIYGAAAVLDCLMGGSYLLEKIGMKIGAGKYPDLKKQGPGAYRSFFKSMLLLVQMRVFLDERRIPKNEQRIRKLVEPNLKLCKVTLNDPLLYELLNAEIFFQERFFLKNELDGQSEQKGSDNLEQSIRLFLSTLEKRVGYHFFL